MPNTETANRATQAALEKLFPTNGVLSVEEMKSVRMFVAGAEWEHAEGVAANAKLAKEIETYVASFANEIAGADILMLRQVAKRLTE